MPSNLLNLMISQFKTFSREPGVLFWVFGFPILIAWILGVAFSSDGTTARRAALITQKSTLQSPFHQWISQKGESKSNADLEVPLIKITLGSQEGEKENLEFVPATASQSERLLKQGKVSLIIEERSDPAELVFHFDPKNADSKLTFLIIKNALSETPFKNIPKRIAAISSIGNRYIDFLVPGLLAIGIMNSCIWGIGWTMIEMRMKKLLRRIIATPLNRSLILLSNFLNRVIITHFELLVLFLFSWWYFDIEVKGSLTALLLVFVSGNVTFGGIAVAMSSRAKSTIVANGLINIITLPMLVLSGIFFSYHNFPEWVIPIVKYLPLTILADSIRAIFIEGSGITDLLQPIALMLTYGLVFFLGSLKFYKWH